MKRILALILVLVMSVTLIGCGSRTSSNEENFNNEQGNEKERILTMDSEDLGYPSVYTVSSKGRGYILVSYIFDTLTWKNEEGTIPLLAEKWEVSKDNLQWTFKLAKNIKFTDGKPLTSQDVKFSYEYMMKHKHNWVNLSCIDKVEAIDEYTVKITLKEVYAPFLNDIAGNVPIMPKHIWEGVEEPEKFNKPEAVIGSGPLKLVNYHKDQGVYEFEANEDYFMGKPVIDKLVLKKTENSMEALKSGEINVASSIKYGQAMQLKEDSNFKTIEGPGFWVLRTYFNFDTPAFKEKDFRQALYYAINREDIVQKGTKNSAIVGNPGHIHPDSEWFYKDVKQYEYSSEKAIGLLDGLGMKDSNGDGIREYNGEKLSFELLATEDIVNVCEMIKKYLSDINIEVTIKAMDTKTVDTLIKEGNFQMAIKGHGSFGGDPVLLARFVTPGSNIGSTPVVTSQGGTQWSNKQFDEIFTNQLKELDKEERYEKVGELQKIIAEELPTLTLYYTKIASSYNPNVFDGWFFTKDGVAISVPTIQNKLVFINGEWKEN